VAEDEPHLSVSAMLAAKLAQARIEESTALARGAVTIEPDEIEMDAIAFDAERADRSGRSDRAARSDRSDRSERSDRLARSDRSGRVNSDGREKARGLSKRDAARRERIAKREAGARAERDALDAALEGKRVSKRNDKRVTRDQGDEVRDEDEGVLVAKSRDNRDAKRDRKRDDAKRGTKRDEVSEGALPANVANKTAAAEGRLAVTSNVPAMIYVDGRATGMMTPKRFAVPAGPHKVTLLEPESKKAKTQDVEIVAGKTASIDKQF
jgi:hypothetical protein